MKTLTVVKYVFRSKDSRVNASEICGVFGGGGHSLAAGIRMAGPLEDAREKVLVEIREAIKRVGIS